MATTAAETAHMAVVEDANKASAGCDVAADDAKADRAGGVTQSMDPPSQPERRLSMRVRNKPLAHSDEAEFRSPKVSPMRVPRIILPRPLPPSAPAVSVPDATAVPHAVVEEMCSPQGAENSWAVPMVGVEMEVQTQPIRGDSSGANAVNAANAVALSAKSPKNARPSPAGKKAKAGAASSGKPQAAVTNGNTDTMHATVVEGNAGGVGGSLTPNSNSKISQAPVVASSEGPAADSERYARLTAEKVKWCRYCGAQATSSWRKGPWGPNTLCNKCGVRYNGLGQKTAVGVNVILNLRAYEKETIDDRRVPLIIEFPGRFSWIPSAFVPPAPGSRKKKSAPSKQKEKKRLQKSHSKSGLESKRRKEAISTVAKKASDGGKKRKITPLNQEKKKKRLAAGLHATDRPPRSKQLPPPRPPPPPPFEIPETASGCARAEGLFRFTYIQKKSFAFPARFPRFLPPEGLRTVAPQRQLAIETGSRSSKAQSALLGDMSRWKRMKERRHTLIIDKSRIHGWGLYTSIDLEKDDIVLEYTGEIVRQSVADKRESIYEAEMGVGTSYLWRIDDDRIVDATRVGNVARLINHSCDPNCFARVVSIDGDKKVAICALRAIRAGEELCYDYKFDIEGDDKKIPCGCGSEKCRGALNG